MSQRFFKGRTNNHLTWKMVDATDFATPESALSAAMTIKVYGKRRGATGVAFITSGTGSLTNDIQHVGPSVLGLYTIAMANADLSDASAAWYDQYIINLSGTGAAFQTLVVEGVIDDSTMSGLISDIQSAVALANSRILVIQSSVSDVFSQLSDFRSDLVSLVTVTGVQLNASTMSDLRSAIDGVSVVLDASNISDIASAVIAGMTFGSVISDAHSAAAQANSRVLLVLSRLSDFDSRMVSDVSDIKSMLTYLSGADSDIYSFLSNLQSGLADASDIASAVWAEAAGAAVSSRVLLNLSRISDIYSQLSDFRSDIASLVTVTGVQLNASTMSDLRSAINALTVTISASDVSDIASAVAAAVGSVVSDAHSAAAQANSRILLVQSRLSDLDSRLVSDVSDIRSMLTAMSDAISDLGSDLRSLAGANHSVASDIYSLLTAGVTVGASSLSDIGSAVLAAAAANPIDANIQEVNDVTLQGDGAGTPWGPA